MHQVFASAVMWAALLVSPSANAAVVIEITEVSGDVRFQVSGSLNTIGLNPLSSGITEDTEQGFMNAARGVFVNLPFGAFSDDSVPYRAFQAYGTNLPPRFGTLDANERGAPRGDAFGLTRAGVLILPDDYVSGTALSAQLIFFGRDLDDLGLTRGTRDTARLANGQSVEFVVPGDPPPAPVPTPAAWIGMVTGAALLARMGKPRGQLFFKR
ncbi:hypothetical protein HK107_12735 [Parvularcula sp. ZS-1/3]|uniref:PEP-CTERM sorting domain-containing protein n=1 Tax=Parvularcula mediterranea TaxID=2732508 RepID=A0A7Y3RP54_9PROT|nr:hypothetical protein [Parvularcula mediterranea]NNU17190.1 hypothetical protein [Parvularcula mediterranea]